MVFPRDRSGWTCACFKAMNGPDGRVFVSRAMPAVDARYPKEHRQREQGEGSSATAHLMLKARGMNEAETF